MNNTISQEQEVKILDSDNQTQQDKIFIKRIREQFKKPYVMKNLKLGLLYVIYSNKVECYKLESSQTKTELDKQEGLNWSAEKEKEMAEGCNFERVFLPKIERGLSK